MQGSGPWVYTNEEEMSNGHNEDALPQPVVPHVEEPESDVVPGAAVPRGSGEFTLGGPRIFVQAPQYHWHSTASVGTGAEAREHLVALERWVFAFGKQMEEREVELLARIAQLEAQ